MAVSTLVIFVCGAVDYCIAATYNFLLLEYSYLRIRWSLRVVSRQVGASRCIRSSCSMAIILFRAWFEVT